MRDKFDPYLQMFIQDPQPVDLNRLWFLRWLMERGDTSDGHVLSQPTGEFAETLPVELNLSSSEDLFAA